MSWHFRTTTIVRLIFYLLLFIQICDPSSARCCLPTICDKHCAVFSHIAWAYSSWVYKRSIEWSHTIKIRLILRMYNISSSKDDTTLCQFEITKYWMDFQIIRHICIYNYKTQYLGKLSNYWSIVIRRIVCS